MTLSNIIIFVFYTARVLHICACGRLHVLGTPKCCTSKWPSDLADRFYVRHLGVLHTCAWPHAFLCFAHGHKNCIATQSHSEPSRATLCHSDSCRVASEVIKINFYFLPHHKILHCLKMHVNIYAVVCTHILFIFQVCHTVQDVCTFSRSVYACMHVHNQKHNLSTPETNLNSWWKFW